MVECPSVRLSVSSFTAAAACGGSAAEHRAGRQEISIDSGGHQAPISNGDSAQGRSSKCGQCHVDSRVDEVEHKLAVPVICQVIGD